MEDKDRTLQGPEVFTSEDKTANQTQGGNSKYDEFVGVSKPSSTRKTVCIGVIVVGVIVTLIGTAVGVYFVLDTTGALTTIAPKVTDDESTTFETTTVQGTFSWSSWSEWSLCDKTCGSGYKQKSRTCLQGTCIGSELESAPCNELVCARKVDQYNTWHTWGPWSECGASCGDSLRQRERTCRDDPNKAPCIGSDVQQLPCNMGMCPDCTTTCDGIWDAGCLVCNCEGTSMSGRVVTLHGGPINGVRITSSDKTYINLTVTGENGSFMLLDLCDGQELLVTLPGYQQQTVVFETITNMTIVLRKIVPLTITKQPQNKARLTSSCVEFQCEATGFPEPEYYEWFKEGMLISGESNRALGMTSLLPDATGYYRCRANNAYGAVLSNEFQLNVKDTQDQFCVNSPLAHTQQLPDGCAYNGKTIVDVGKCATGVCSKGNELCDQGTSFQCGILQSQTIFAECTSYQLPIQIVKECGCIEHETLYLEVLGTVIDVSTNNVISSIEISSGSVVIESSSDGEFVLSLAVGSTRSVLTLHDPLGRYSDQVSSIDFGQDVSGAIEHVVRMTPKAPPIIVSAASEIVVGLGSDGEQDAFADIIIPANALYSSDGELFEGDVSLSVDTFDPRNNSLDANPPGDFSAVGDEGEPEILESVGMMQMNFQDTDGNSLSLGGEVEILIPETLISSDDNIEGLKLWSLNTLTGRWEYAADINSQPKRKRKKRYTYTTSVRGIDIDSEWFNFDYISDQICHTKIRVYKTNDFEEDEQLSKADVQIVTLPSASSSSTTLTRVRSWSDDTTDANGYCIVHPCNSRRSSINHQYHGYIIVDYNGIGMTPADDAFDGSMDFEIHDNKIYAKFDYFAGQDGPYYDWDYYWGSSSQCSDAPIDAKHFRFYEGDRLACKAGNDDYTRQKRVQRPIPDISNIFSWEYAITGNGYRACFLKVITTWDFETQVEATSVIWNAGTNGITNGEVFGARTECTINRAACLEIRSPFGVTDGIDYNLASTKVDIRVIGVNVIGKFPNQNLLNNGHVISTNDQNEVQLLLPDDTYGAEYGIYCSENLPSYAQAKKQAQKSCRIGTSGNIGQGSGNSKKDITTTGWAAWFGEHGKCPGGHTSPRQCPSSPTDLKYFEYCNDQGFVCWACPSNSLSEKIIPEYINEAGYCDNAYRTPVYQGCCPTCPGGDYSYGSCSSSDYNNTMYEYCSPINILCPTCPVFNTIPDYPNSNGQCDNEEYELNYAGCCPQRPRCPGGYEPYRSCNSSIDVNNVYEYCTPEGFVCNTCHINSYYTEKVIPDYPNEDGSCENSNRRLFYEGCCPSCPGGHQSHGLCTNQTYIDYDNQYCSEGYVCYKCPLYGTIPEEPDINGQCSNNEHERDYKGCCLSGPKCPGGYSTNKFCNETEYLYSHEYCTDEGYICQTCYNYWHHEYDSIIPLPPNDVGICDDPNHRLFWEGCCPMCPGGNEALGLCDISTNMTSGVYCTSYGAICEMCPGDITPTSPNTNGNCNNTHEYLDWRGCCPSCPAGIPHLLDTTCIANGTSYLLSTDTFCSPGGLVCPTCPMFPSIIPEYYISFNQLCDDTSLESSCAGCCPSAPKCPQSPGICPSLVCTSDSDCSIDEYCTHDGVCCGLSRCRLTYGYIVAKRVNVVTGECDDPAFRLTLDGCCPVYCYHLDYNSIYPGDVFGDYLYHTCSQDSDCYYSELHCNFGWCEYSGGDFWSLLNSYFVHGLPLCSGQMDCQASNSSVITGACHNESLCCVHN